MVGFFTFPSNPYYFPRALSIPVQKFLLFSLQKTILSELMMVNPLRSAIRPAMYLMQMTEVLLYVRI